MTSPKSTGADQARSMLDWANRYAPEAVTIAAGGLAVLAVAAFAVGSGLGWNVAAGMGLVVALLGAGTIVLQRWARAAAPKYFMEFMSWGVGILGLIALTSIMFPSKSDFGSRIWEWVTGKTATIQVNPDVLRLASLNGRELADFGEPTTSGAERSKELAKRKSLVLAGGLVLDGSRKIYASSIKFDGAQIVTNGHALTLEAVTIDARDGASIIAFKSPTPTPGSPGKNGPDVRLVAHKQFTGALAVELSGTKGADGVKGSPGLAGPAGAQGNNAVSNLFDCRSGAGRGGNGQNGGAGEPGRPGFAGGNGGSLLVTSAATAELNKLIEFTSNGGTGGAGGDGGPGGPGGAGGPGGNARPPFCQGNGPQGAPGANGPAGKSGDRGPDGAPGKVRFEKLTF